MRQPKCGTDARCEGCWTDCGYPSDDVPELVSGDIYKSILSAKNPSHGDNLIYFHTHLKNVLGHLITLEGIDGSGKSTVAKHIASKLAELMPERKLVLTAEPTTGDTGKILRMELAKTGPKETSVAQRMEELFLFMADHAGHLAKTVIPSLEEGAIILSDRYTDSTAAYQGVTLRNIVPDPVQWIRSLYQPWNLQPDRTLLFILDPNLALQRMQSRPGREKFERLEFLQSVDENFRRLATEEPERFVLIDASVSAELVAEKALLAVLELIS